MHYMRLWDSSAANRVDAFLANSGYVARRIGKIYRRPARVLYPPVDVGRFRAYAPREDFFLAVSRFAPYKRMDLIVEAFTRSGKPLVVIGDGPEFEKVRRMAGNNVEILGRQPDAVVADYLQRALALVFAAEEDFGIVPVEAQAAGCPVIAYGKGGALETVVPYPDAGATGMFFEEQSPEAIMEAVESFEQVDHEFDPENCHRNAERFGRERFQREFEDVLRELWEKFQIGDAME
jgi:glycosyltransferase involved in cell wall biosynthesis